MQDHLIVPTSEAATYAIVRFWRIRQPMNPRPVRPAVRTRRTVNGASGTWGGGPPLQMWLRLSSPPVAVFSIVSLADSSETPVVVVV